MVDNNGLMDDSVGNASDPENTGPSVVSLVYDRTFQPVERLYLEMIETSFSCANYPGEEGSSQDYGLHDTSSDKCVPVLASAKA